MLIEQVEKLLGEKGNIPYNPENISVGEGDENKTIKQLYYELSEMRQEVQKRLLTHKLEPYLGTGNEDFISKVAATLLENKDILEERLRDEFENKLVNMLERYKKLDMFFLKDKPSNTVISRLKEASECYVQGYFQGCAILCRAVLEAAIKEKMQAKLPIDPENKPLQELLDGAKKFGIISEEDYKEAKYVKGIGNDTAHDPRRCSPEEAYKSLTKTKLLLNKLYR